MNRMLTLTLILAALPVAGFAQSADAPARPTPPVLDFATADAEFFRENSDRRGRQTQAWVKFPDGPFGGWKVVSAHVSLEGSTH